MIDEIDAQTVEAALVEMRRERPAYWSIFEHRYLRGFTDDTVCRVLRYDRIRLYLMLRAAFHWLHRRLNP